mmetsp:Transcript_6045/g.8621  ORF Transcript_6045/g.8621 Transcript_6045/m.8621 type:complete len:288 (+) Transcript_6045:933-1796(+)
MHPICFIKFRFFHKYCPTASISKQDLKRLEIVRFRIKFQTVPSYSHVRYGIKIKGAFVGCCNSKGCNWQRVSSDIIKFLVLVVFLLYFQSYSDPSRALHNHSQCRKRATWKVWIVVVSSKQVLVVVPTHSFVETNIRVNPMDPSCNVCKSCRSLYITGFIGTNFWKDKRSQSNQNIIITTTVTRNQKWSARISGTNVAGLVHGTKDGWIGIHSPRPVLRRTFLIFQIGNIGFFQIVKINSSILISSPSQHLECLIVLWFCQVSIELNRTKTAFFIAKFHIDILFIQK